MQIIFFPFYPVSFIKCLIRTESLLLQEKVSCLKIYQVKVVLYLHTAPSLGEACCDEEKSAKSLLISLLAH